MKYFIKIENGAPTQWPIAATEVGAFAPEGTGFPADCSDADLTEFGFLPFTVVEQPVINRNTQTLAKGTPAQIDGVWTQVWTVTYLTADEIAARSPAPPEASAFIGEDEKDQNTIVKLVDNVFVRAFRLLKAGDTNDGTAHTYDHLTLLAKGTVIMRTQQAIEKPVAKQFVAPDLITTPKGLVHQFEAVTDDCLLCCIHAIRDGETVDDIAPQEITQDDAAALLAKFPLSQASSAGA